MGKTMDPEGEERAAMGGGRIEGGAERRRSETKGWGNEMMARQMAPIAAGGIHSNHPRPKRNRRFADSWARFKSDAGKGNKKS